MLPLFPYASAHYQTLMLMIALLSVPWCTGVAQHGRTRQPLSPPALVRLQSRSGAAQARLQQDAAHGGAVEGQPLRLRQHFGQVLMIEPSVAALRELEYPRLARRGDRLPGYTTTIAMQ